jgi:CBS domain-containing protein
MICGPQAAVCQKGHKPANTIYLLIYLQRGWSWVSGGYNIRRSKKKDNGTKDSISRSFPFFSSFKGCKEALDTVVGDVMERSVVSVDEDASLEDVLSLFEEHHFHTFPVVNKDEELVGIIDQNIILEIILFAHLPRIKHTHRSAVRLLGDCAKDIMVTHPLTISPDMTICKTADMMLKTRFNRVCVVEDKKLVGIISKRDIINEIYRRGTQA